MSYCWRTKSGLPSPRTPFLLLFLPLSLSVNEAHSSPEHKHWDLSTYHSLGTSAQLCVQLPFSITASRRCRLDSPLFPPPDDLPRFKCFGHHLLTHWWNTDTVWVQAWGAPVCPTALIFHFNAHYYHDEQKNAKLLRPHMILWTFS